MGFPCLSACNSLIYSTMLLHKLMMTGNSSGLDSPSLFGKGEKQQIRKVERECEQAGYLHLTPTDTCRKPDQNHARTLAAFQHHSSCSFFQLVLTAKSMTCDYCRKGKSEEMQEASFACVVILAEKSPKNA